MSHRQRAILEAHKWEKRRVNDESRTDDLDINRPGISRRQLKNRIYAAVDQR